MDDAWRDASGPSSAFGERRLDECTDALRRLCLGALAPVLFHEIGNILTVLNGIRQVVLEAGAPAGTPGELGPRYGELIAAQVTHSEEVAAAFRSMNPEPAESDTDALAVRDKVAALLELRARGRQVRIVRAGTAGWALDRSTAYGIKLALLGGCSALLEKVFATRAPARITLILGGDEAAASGSGREITCRCQVRGTGRAPRGTGRADCSTGVMLDLARELARRHGADLTTTPAADALAEGGPEPEAGLLLELVLRLSAR